jgi:hypothetical protein
MPIFNFFENCDLKKKNKDHMLFFLRDTMIVRKQNSSYHSPHKSTLNESKASRVLCIGIHLFLFQEIKK